MMVSYYPKCIGCDKSLAIGSRNVQKKYCEDCKKERIKIRNRKYRKTFFVAKRLKPAYITQDHLDFIKDKKMNFSLFVRSKLDEEMKK